jgi:hypothetical protein
MILREILSRVQELKFTSTINGIPYYSSEVLAPLKVGAKGSCLAGPLLRPAFGRSYHIAKVCEAEVPAKKEDPRARRNKLLLSQSLKTTHYSGEFDRVHKNSTWHKQA